MLVLPPPERSAAFKPRSFRNVTRRAPYMHGGQLGTLADVLRHAAHRRQQSARTELHRLGLTERERAPPIAFLRTLESPIRG